MVNISGIYKKIRKFTKELDEKHISAYAAKTAYFIMLSFIPVLMLLFSVVQHTALGKADVLTLFVNVFPDNIDPIVVFVIDEIYGKSEEYKCKEEVTPQRKELILWQMLRR